MRRGECLAFFPDRSGWDAPAGRPPCRRAPRSADARSATAGSDERRALRSDPPPRVFLSDMMEAPACAVLQTTFHVGTADRRRRTVEAERSVCLPSTRKSAPRPIGQTAAMAPAAGACDFVDILYCVVSIQDKKHKARLRPPPPAQKAGRCAAFLLSGRRREGLLDQVRSGRHVGRLP